MKHIMYFVMTGLLLVMGTACSDLYSDIFDSTGYMLLDRPVLNDLSISATDETFITLDQPVLLKTGIPSCSMNAYIGLEGSITATGPTVSGYTEGPVDMSEGGCSFRGLSVNTVYTIIVVADNAVGSSIKTITQKTSAIAPVLKDLSLASTSDTSITLARPAFSVAGNPFPKVEAYIGPQGAIYASGTTVSGYIAGPVDVSGGGYTFSGLAPEKMYRIIVVASNLAGHSVKHVYPKKNLYFFDKPIYYSQCEDMDDIGNNPLIGSEFSPVMKPDSEGGYRKWDFVTGRFFNGFRVADGSKEGGDFTAAYIYPFGEALNGNKTKLPVGTCAYWASSDGGWRGKGENTHLHSKVLFYLTDNTYIYTLTEDKHSTSVIKLVVDGKTVFSGGVPDGAMVPYVLQWDLVNGFEGGANIRFYFDGALRASVTAAITQYDIDTFLQYFFLKAWNDKTGDYRDWSEVIIDNIIIWNKIVDAGQIMSITNSDGTLD